MCFGKKSPRLPIPFVCVSLDKMTSLFSGDRNLGYSRRDSISPSQPPPPPPSLCPPLQAPTFSLSKAAFTTSAVFLCSLPSLFSDLTPTLSITVLHKIAYEIFIALCRTSPGKPLTYVSSNGSSNSGSSHANSNSLPSNLNLPTMQRLLTSTAVSNMKKVLGMRSGTSNTSLDSEDPPPTSESTVLEGHSDLPLVHSTTNTSTGNETSQIPSSKTWLFQLYKELQRQGFI